MALFSRSDPEAVKKLRERAKQEQKKVEQPKKATKTTTKDTKKTTSKSTKTTTKKNTSVTDAARNAGEIAGRTAAAVLAPSKNNKKTTTKTTQKTTSKSTTKNTQKTTSKTTKTTAQPKITTPNVNFPSAINLGLGPISRQKAESLIKSGDVKVDTKGNLKWNNDYAIDTKKAYDNAKYVTNTKTTTTSDMTEKERKSRIKEIDKELQTLNYRLRGLGRANMGGEKAQAYYKTEREKTNARIAELSEEKKKLERVGSYTASEMKQFEIDDAKAKKAQLPNYNPTARVSPSGLNAFLENAKAHTELDKQIDTLERQKKLYDEISKFSNTVHKDDYEGGLGAWFKNFDSQWRANYRSNELSREADKAMSEYDKNPTDENRQIAYAYDAFSQAYAKNNAKALDDENVKASLLTKTFAGYLPQLKDQIIPELVGGTLGGALFGKTGSTIGAGIASYAQSYDVIRGSVLRTLLAEGVDEEIARQAAADEAVISSLIEGGETAISWLAMGGTKALSAIGNAAKSSVAKGSTNAATKYIANMATKSATKAATKAATEATRPLWSKALRMAGGVVVDALGEYGEEYTQGAVSKANREKALATVDKEIGQYGEGNIDLYNRPIYKNEDGTISTVDSVTYNIDGKYVVLPTIVRDENGKPKRLTTDDEIIEWYINTGEYLGKFDTLNEANSYATKVHTAQAYYYDKRYLDNDDGILSGSAKVIAASLNGKNPELFGELNEQGIEGLKIGLMMGGGKTILSNVATRVFNAKTIKNQNEILDTIINDDETLTALIEEGKASGEGTVSAKVATEVEQAKASGKVTREQVKNLIAANEVYIQEENKTNSEVADKTAVEEVKKATSYGDNGARVLIDAMDKSGSTFAEIKNEMHNYYEAGLINKPVALKTDLQQEAYYAGKKDRQMSKIKATEGIFDNKVYSTEESGLITPESTNKGSFNPAPVPQSVSPKMAKALDMVGKSLGRKVMFVEDIVVNEEGAKANSRVRSDGVFEISVNSKKPLYELVTHEPVHIMRLENTKEYHDFVNFAVDHAEMLGIRLEENDTLGNMYDRLHDAYEQRGLDIEADALIDEITARFAETLVSGEQEAIDLITKMNQNENTRTALQKFFDVFKSVISKLKELYNRLRKNGEYSAARGLNDTITELEQAKSLYEKAYRATQKAVVQRQADTNSSNNLEIKTNEEYNGNESYSLENEGYSTKGTHWAIANGLLSEQDQAIFWEDISNLTQRGFYIPQSKSGQYIIDLGQKLVFTNGDYKKTSISCIVEFVDGYEENINEYKEWIINEERDTAQHGESLQIVEILQGAGYVSEHFPSDYRTNAGQNGSGKGTNSNGNSSKTSKVTSYSLEGEDLNKLSTEEKKAVDALGDGAKALTDKNGKMLIATDKGKGTVMYSLETYNNGGKEALEKALRANGHTEAEIRETLSWVDDAGDYLTILAAGYAKTHNYTALSNHLIADVITNVKTGKQVISAIVNNGDYPVNIDLALICKKRVAYMNLMNRLIDDGIFDKVNYGGEAIAKVNDLLRADGFETACLGCFVESRRLQFQTWAETIVSEWNAEVDKRTQNAESFSFADGKAKLTDAEMDALAEELKNAGKKNAQGNLNLGQGSVQTRMGRLLDKVPSLQKHLTVADLLKPEGLTALRAYDSNLFSLVKSRYGAASPKIVQDYNPYASEIAMMTFSSVKNITSNAIKGADAYRRKVINEMGGRPTKQKGETTKEFNARKAEFNAKVEDEAMRRYLYDIGGARIQSFSDFMIENVFDYIQIFADLSAKRLPLHGYTKEIIALRLFGMTGAKWNGSLIAHVDRAMGKEYAGLLPASEAKDGSAILVHTKDGDYAIGFDDYARYKATNKKTFIQSIGMKDIVALQLDPRYSSYVGSITIGVSDKQILAMLDSPLFRFVIPYHSSGMLPQFAKLVGVDLYNDYTDYQNTTVNKWYDASGKPCEPIKDGKGDTLKVDTSYNFNAEVQKTGDAKKAADNYLKWCAEKHPVYDGKKRVGYVTFTPKFANSPYGTDFSKHENYYKLLEDFNVYDNITEESAVQGAVTMNFPSEQNRLSATEMEAYKERLRETGIFSEKEIEKYSAIADKTFKELIAEEVKGRADYQNAQAPKWEGTIKNVENMLLKDHKRDAYSLQDDIEVKPEETKEMLGTYRDVKQGKVSSAKLSKYVDSGMIRTDEYDALVQKYGAIHPGENPHRDVEVPRKTGKDKKVSQTVRTVLEAEVTPDTALPTIEKMVEDGVFSYDVYTDKQAIQDAQDMLKGYGWVSTYTDWMNDVKDGIVSKQHTVQGWAIYNNAVNRAAEATTEDAKKEAMEVALNTLDMLVRHQRNAAQALQATRVLKKLSPETQLYGIQKSVNAFQKELIDKYGKKAPNLKIDEELAEKFLGAETQEERDIAMKEIYKDIGRKMTSRFVDKWNAWRYLAMLGNPRTHVRNIFGNLFFAPVVAVKDLPATIIESIVAPAVRLSGKEMLRSKSLVWGSKNDIALLMAAWRDYANVADAISNGGKYNDFAVANQQIEEGRKVFKSKVLAPVEWLRKANSKALEVEDVWFSMPHYAYALAQYCKANNITAEQIAKGKAIAPAREYAIKEAQKATYKDTNTFSQMVSEWGRNINEKNAAKKAFNTVVEGILPFRKTPANILVRGVEYSPLGLLKGLTRDLYKVAKGEMYAHEAIDNISAGLTGTGLMALGVWLAAEGLVRGHGEDDEEERKFKEMQGHQSYALELPNGTSITLDWLAPEALPFFVGVNLWEATKGSDEETNLASILNAIKNISEPMLEMSCLQGLNDLIEGVGNASSNETSGLVAILSSAVTSYLTQGIPTLAGQAERTSEEERMTTYIDKNGFLTGDMQYTFGKASAKIPGWDYSQIPFIDAWGRREASGTALKRGLSNFLNPAYTSKIESSDVEEELLYLYNFKGETSVFPQRADKYFMVDGVRKDLTAEEYIKYATLKGEKSYELVSDLIHSDAYKNLDVGEKIRAIEDVYDYANQKAKEAISNYKPEKWVEKADELGDVDSYIFFRTNVNEVRESNDGKIKKAEVVDIIGNTTQDDSEAWSLYMSMYDYPQAHEAEKHGIDADTYMNAVVAMYDIHSDYYYNGKIVDGAELTAEQRKTLKYVRNSRRRKVEKYLNSVCNSYKDYLFLLGTEYSSITDDADYVSYFGK